MPQVDYKEYIEVNAEVRFGKPVIKAPPLLYMMFCSGLHRV
jgi:hypothetical protein